MSSADPVGRLADLRMVKASAEIEAELVSKANSFFKMIFFRFRDRASEALVALAFIDAEDTKHIRALQNEVKRFDEFVADVRKIVADGVRIDQELDAEAREEMLDILTASPQGEREAINLGLVDGELSDA